MLDPNHLFLTIHESVGHPLELDRVLGYEANYAGTSFATLDKWRAKDFQYGSDQVNDLRRQDAAKHSLGAVGYDDEGVTTKRWDLIKDGMLVNYQATRDQVHILGEKESHGCSYARLVVERAVPAHAERLAGRRQGHAVRRRRWSATSRTASTSSARLVLDRPAALQRAVRRPAVLRDQGRQGHAT